jgi:hypothetical protein
MTFINTLGLRIYSSCNASYYIMDTSARRAYILNDDWSHVSYKNFNNLALLIIIGYSIYVMPGRYSIVP